MDYDDNDFQNQNFQLVGEDNSRFPQSLQSFSLPKFDIDDNLQIQLRYDSLAETNSLLGIQGQENNWLEEFSARHGAINFSSNAGEACSISMHNNVWSEATSSESVEMLLKSVGEDEMLNQEIINKDSDTLTMDDSSDCRMETDIHKEPNIVTNKCQSEDVVGIHQPEEHTSQKFKDEPPNDESDQSLLDEKTDFSGKVGAMPYGNDVKLKPSSDVSLNDHVFLEIVQSDDPTKNTSVLNNTFDHSGCAAKSDTNEGPSSLNCNSSQEVPSDAFMDNTNTLTRDMTKESFPRQRVESDHGMRVGVKPELLHPDNELNLGSHIYSVEGTIIDQHFEVHNANNDTCNVTISSSLEPLTDSLVLLNERNSDTGFSRNSEGLLESIAYQVKVKNKDSGLGKDVLSCSKETTSMATPSDVSAQKETSAVGGEDVTKLSCIVEESKEYSLVVQESVSGSLHLRSSLTKSTYIVGPEEEQELATRQADTVVQDPEVHLSTNICNELNSSSEGVVNLPFSTLTTLETRVPATDIDNIRAEPLNSTSSDHAMLEKSIDGRVTDTVVNENSNDKLVASDDSVINNAPTSAIKISSSDICKSVPLAVNENSKGEPGALEDTIIMKPPVSDDKFSTFSDDCISAPMFDTEKLPASLSRVESTGLVMDDSSLKGSTLGQAVVEGAAAAVVSSPSDCNKDSNTLSSGKNNLGTTDTPAPFEVPATVSSGSLTKNFPESSTGEELCGPAGETSLGTGQDTNQGSKDNADPLHNSENATEGNGGNDVSSGGNCGSPTVISCRKSPQGAVECQEGNGGFSDSAGAASEINSSDQVKCMGIASKDDSFTFEVQAVVDAPQKDTDKDLNPCSVMHLSELPQISASSSQVRQKRPRKGGKHSATNETNDDGKIKQASSPMSRRTSNMKDKEKSQTKKGRGRGRNPCSMSPNPDKTINKTQMEVIGQHSCSESSSMKSSCSPSIPTSGVPNTCISPVALSHRPFTDLQQLQLRAQIFVYGSLIQGVPPEESCMISAFGGTDGGRNLWGVAWRAASERFQNQKSPLNSYMTLLQPRSGPFTAEQMSNSKSTPGKNISSTGKGADKVTPSAELNFAPSLPSPLWSTSSSDGLPSRSAHLEFYQSVSPLHPYQPTQGTQYTSNATPWLSQSPHPASWVFPSHGIAFDTSAQYSTVSAAEKVQVTPAKDLPAPGSSNMQFNSPSSLLPHQGRVNVSSPLVSSIVTQKNLLTPASTKKGSNAQESRKRKKVSATEGPLVSQPQLEYATTVNMQTPAPTTFGLFCNSPSVIPPPSIVSATSHPVTSSNFLSEETVVRVDQSKHQAENASACAAAAVSYSQGIWSQLATQRQSSLISEVEAKLASAAVAAAAAASVAKAAAEAAKVASEAALQAKMMADEAVDSVKIGNTVLNFEVSLDVANNLSKLSPVSFLKTKDKPGSVISAAREAARKRIEAASAAAKRAENLDAIMKAAELAAEAISQAGTIISMGDPLPFSLQELVEAGPEGYWKVHATRGNVREKADDAQVREKVDDDHGIHATRLNERNYKEKQKASDAEGRPTNNEQAVQLVEKSEGRQSESVLENLPASDLAKDFSSDNMLGSIIQKGSLVEVSAIKENLKGAWFSAWVLDLKDGKAYICYKDLLNEGREQLKEWIPLEHDNDKAPRIRAAHPITVAKPEGTRKRRRDAVGTWEVGDRVDVWMRNGWWEGIVTEKNREDETKLTVHFPGGKGDASAVRAWNLRPSLIWQDGQWSKWTHTTVKPTSISYEGDSPVEKRQKVGRIESESIREMDGRVVGNLPRANHMDEPMKLDESRQLALTARDKLFSVGTTTREANNTKVKRAGLAKEGSRVVIGVPKPGKRRKFMEVSKHYTTDKTDTLHEGSDSIKFTKYLMPQTSNLWRSTTRVESKGKEGIDSKPRGLKSIRSKKTQARNTAEKDNMSVGTESAINSGESGLSSLPNLRTSINEESALERSNLLEIPVLESGLQPVSGIASLKQKSSVNEDISGKGKIFPASEKLTKIENKRSEDSGNVASEGEPRRSNRRIQPTSRLLEGLQSSLIMSKIPSISHDRTVKTSSRTVSSSRGHNHG